MHRLLPWACTLRWRLSQHSTYVRMRRTEHTTLIQHLICLQHVHLAECKEPSLFGHRSPGYISCCGQRDATCGASFMIQGVPVSCHGHVFETLTFPDGGPANWRGNRFPRNRNKPATQILPVNWFAWFSHMLSLRNWEDARAKGGEAEASFFVRVIPRSCAALNHKSHCC